MYEDDKKGAEMKKKDTTRAIKSHIKYIEGLTQAQIDNIAEGIYLELVLVGAIKNNGENKKCPHCGEKAGTYNLGAYCCACHQER